MTTTSEQDVSLGMPELPAPDYPADVRARLEADAREIIARYPDSRSRAAAAAAPRAVGGGPRHPHRDAVLRRACWT